MICRMAFFGQVLQDSIQTYIFKSLVEHLIYFNILRTLIHKDNLYYMIYPTTMTIIALSFIALCMQSYLGGFIGSDMSWSLSHEVVALIWILLLWVSKHKVLVWIWVLV